MKEIYKLPQGRIIFIHTSKDLNIGFLFLNPHQELPKHNRPVDEELTQVSGECVMKIFDNENVKEISLSGNESLLIHANQFHIHSNPTDKVSITMWKFEGDISQVLQKIRDENEKIS